MWVIALYIAVSVVFGYLWFKKSFPFKIFKRRKKESNVCEIPPEVCIGRDLSDCESCKLKPECKEFLIKQANNQEGLCK